MIKVFFLLFHQYQESFKDFYWKKKDSVATTKHLRIVNTPQFTNLHNMHTFVLASVQTKCKIIFKTPKTTLHGDKPCGFLSELMETTDFESLMIERIDVNHTWVAVPTIASFILLSPLSSIISVTICPHECDWINIV